MFLGYIGILKHKEHPPEVWHIPPWTPCIVTSVKLGKLIQLIKLVFGSRLVSSAAMQSYFYVFYIFLYIFIYFIYFYVFLVS